MNCPVQPTLETDRLILRPFFLPTDAPDVYRLAGEREIAATTANIPHPYPEDLAERSQLMRGILPRGKGPILRSSCVPTIDCAGRWV